MYWAEGGKTRRELERRRRDGREPPVLPRSTKLGICLSLILSWFRDDSTWFISSDGIKVIVEDVKFVQFVIELSSKAVSIELSSKAVLAVVVVGCESDVPDDPWMNHFSHE